MKKIPRSQYTNILDWMLQRIECGPFDGGCLLYAQALQKVLGGEVWVIEGSRVGQSPIAQHAFLKTADGVFHDASGSGNDSEMVQNFYKEEIPLKRTFKLGGLRPWRPQDLLDAPVSSALVQALAARLQSGFQAETMVSMRTIEQEHNLLRSLIQGAGYTIQSHQVGFKMEGWWALLPGETSIKEDPDTGNQNYLGFFSRESDLLDEVGGELLQKRSDAIKVEYLESGCQAADVDEAVSKLMSECWPLFENDRFAWSFLMEEDHEELEEVEEGPAS